MSDLTANLCKQRQDWHATPGILGYIPRAMSETAEKYRSAAKAAQRMAFAAVDEKGRAAWSEHATEWLRKADEVEEAERSGK